jgi:AraC-like DNA-binding protein
MEPYFEANKNQSGITDLDRPFYIGNLTTVQEGYQIAPHWHYHIEIIYMAYGYATAVVGSHSYELRQGDLLIVFPCEVHSVAIATGVASLHYVIGFDPELLRPMPSLAFQLAYMLPYAASLSGQKPFIAATASDQEPLLSLIEEMHEEYVDKKDGFELSVTSDIFKLVVRLLRQNALSTIGDGDLSVQSGTLKTFREMLVYLNENCHQNLSAADAAKRSLMSYSRLASLFKQTMQTSFSHYLMFLRIRKAEQQLLDSSKSMTQIALECGFNSPSYFIKQFKRSKGLSPMQYRKKNDASTQYPNDHRQFSALPIG